MAHVRSAFDARARMRSTLPDAVQWNNVAAGDGGFRIDIDDDPAVGPVVIEVSGDLDAVTAPVLTACLDQALRTGHQVVVDLLDVPFLGCAGVAALHHAATGLLAQRCRMTVAAPPGMHTLLDRIGTTAAVPCYDTLADAFHAASSPHPTAPDSVDPSFPIPGRPHSLTCSLAALPAGDSLDERGTPR
ncbi:STAS domain-containing protein [Rhodococcus sp. NPDC056960]|uniref:STAS domain-containing protein n=1 Tax=Rhodococcus sp. NPDC056960 TaxID=3345982 RepID=UPI0036455723